MAKQLAFLLLLLIGTSASAQENKWLVSYDLGLGAGWWVYDKGLTDTLPQIHRGYDRTHLSFLLHQSFSASFSTPKFLFGVQAGFNRLADPTVVGSDNRRGGFRKYELSEGEKDYVPFTHVAGKFGWHLINKEKLRLTPIVILGTSWVQATHPEASNFDRRYYRAGELQFSVELVPNFNLLLFPRYTNFLLRDSSVPYQGAKHNIYGIGLHGGFELSY